MYDLAQALGISVGTVYRALHKTGRINPETQRKVLEMAARMDYQINSNAQSLRMKTQKIGFLICCPIKQFGDEIEKGAKAALEDIGGFNLIIDFRVTPNVNAEQGRTEVSKALLDFSDGDYDGAILFLSGSTAAFKKDLAKLDEKGIPIVTLVNDIPLSHRVLHVAADGFTAGKMAADILSLCCKGGIVAVLTGSKETYIHHENLEGFMAGQVNRPFARVDVWEHQDDPDTVRSQMHKILTNHPGYDGIYITSASVIEAFEILNTEKTGEFPYIVTTDLFVENRMLLRKRIASATIFQSPYQQGKKAVSRIYQILCGKNVEPRLLVMPQPVFPSNEPLMPGDVSGMGDNL